MLVNKAIKKVKFYTGRGGPATTSKSCEKNRFIRITRQKDYITVLIVKFFVQLIGIILIVDRLSSPAPCAVERVILSVANQLKVN